MEERNATLLELQGERRGRFDLRAAIAAELSTEKLEGDIRVTVAAAVDIQPYADLLAEILHGQYLRAELVREIARCIRPADLAALVRATDPARIVGLDDAKTGQLARAHKIIVAIEASGRLLDLEAIGLGDVPRIELRVGEAYQPSSELSFGERCTAILPILFLQSPNPLLIDQPEDHLANEYVFNVARQIAPSRKAISTNHRNPSPTTRTSPCSPTPSGCSS